MTDLITDRSVGFIEKHARRPFFIDVAYNAPHWPYQVPGKPSVARDGGRHLSPFDDSTSTRADYVAMIEHMDRGVGRILADARPARHPRQHDRHLHERQRRGVALAECAAVPSQVVGVGRRHPRPGDRAMAGPDSRRERVAPGGNHDGSHRVDPRRDRARRCRRRVAGGSEPLPDPAGTCARARADALLARLPRARSARSAPATGSS